MNFLTIRAGIYAYAFTSDVTQRLLVKLRVLHADGPGRMRPEASTKRTFEKLLVRTALTIMVSIPVMDQAWFNPLPGWVGGGLLSQRRPKSYVRQ